MAVVQEYRIITFDEILGGALGRADAEAAREWMQGDQHIETYPTDDEWVRKVRVKDTRVYSVEEEEQGLGQEEGGEGNGVVESHGLEVMEEQEATQIKGHDQIKSKVAEKGALHGEGVIDSKVDRSNAPAHEQITKIGDKSDDLQVQQVAAPAQHDLPSNPVINDSRTVSKPGEQIHSGTKRSVGQQEYWKGIKLLVDESDTGAVNQTYSLSRDGLVADSEEFKNIIDKSIEALKRSDSAFWREKMKSAVYFVRRIASSPLKYCAKAGAAGGDLAKQIILLQRRKFALADDDSPIRNPYKDLELEDLEEPLQSPGDKRTTSVDGGKEPSAASSPEGNVSPSVGRKQPQPQVRTVHSQKITGRKRPRKSLKPLHATAALQ